MALPNLSQISEALDKIMPELTPVPVGTVAFAHEVPTGWLQCNGAAVSRTTYARLFKKIGTKYGAGDGSTTFNLLDLHHLVLEGTNTPSEVAQKVEAGLPDITGEFNVDTQNFARWGTVALGGAFTSVNPYNVFSHDGAGTEMTRTTGIKMEASRANAIYGGTAVQMPSLRLMAVIRT